MDKYADCYLVNKSVREERWLGILLRPFPKHYERWGLKEYKRRILHTEGGTITTEMKWRPWWVRDA